MNKQARLNYWVNHPGIIEYMAPGYIFFDASGFFRDSENIMLTHPQGVMLFFRERWNGPAWRGHYLFGDRLRGRRAKNVAERMLNTVFTRHEAAAIFGTIWVGNRPARLMTRALGFEPTGHGSVDYYGRPTVDYFLSRGMWRSLPWSTRECWNEGVQ